MGIYSKFIGWLLSTRVDRRLHFVAGVIVGSFFALALKVEWCIVPVVFVAFVKEFVDAWRGGEFEWGDFFSTLLGGALVEVFQIVGGLW